MARLALVTVFLAAIALALVHARRQEVRLQHEIQTCQSRQIALRRRLWLQRVRIGRLVAPAVVRQRVQDMALDLTAEDESRPRLADVRPDPASGCEH